MSKYFTKIDMGLFDISDIPYTWMSNQICLNTSQPDGNNHWEGVGSLGKDWSKSRTVNGTIIVPDRAIRLREDDFKYLCLKFKSTVFEDMYNEITSRYRVGRVRLMKLPPHQCLSWHTDSTQRLHYPIKTNEKCFMVIENEIKHLPQNEWWLADTVNNYHTVFNGSEEERIHLVACLL